MAEICFLHLIAVFIKIIGNEAGKAKAVRREDTLGYVIVSGLIIKEPVLLDLVLCGIPKYQIIESPKIGPLDYIETKV